MFYIKYFILFFLCFSSPADKTPSFSFSEEKGLKPLTEKENPLKQNIQSKQNTKSKENLQQLKPSSKQDSSVLSETDSETQILKTKGVETASDKKTNSLNKTEIKKSNSEISAKGSTTKSEASMTQETEKALPFEEKISKEKPTKDSAIDSKKATQDSISESFAPKEKSLLDETESFFKDVSWVFQKEQTKHKLALVPIYSYDKTESSRFGFRVFSFSPEEKGYFLAFSGAKYGIKNYYSSSLTYKSKRDGVFRSELSFIYDDHYELYYGSLEEFQGMKAALDDVKKLESHRLILDYNLFYQEKEKAFYFGAGARAFFRQERRFLQENKSHFPSEYFIFLRAFGGMDTRDNWKYPKKGVFHQASLGCKASLVFSSAYCQTHGDLRFYTSPAKEGQAPNFIKNSVLSFRAFYGTSLFNPSSYATKYSLGGESFFQQLNNLRGFKNRRFLGDKIYLGQSELRVPVWKEYVILALFLEMGEAAQLGDSFDAFVTNYGGGVRVGWPGDSGMKIRFDYSMGRDRQNKINTDFIISFLQAF